MLVKIISVFFDPGSGQFDDTEVQDFLKGKEVISINDHFFARGDVPYLVLVIKYSIQRKETESKAVNPTSGRRDESWRESLSETDIGKFELLREWRAKRSRLEAVPPYILFTNRQLVELIKLNPKSLSDLEKVDGVGRAKTEKYGQDILEITKAATTEVEALNP